MKYFGILAAIVCNFFLLNVHANGNYCCPPNPCCDSSGFDGLYFGGNLGVSGFEMIRRDLDGFLSDNGTQSGIDIDATAGIQLGYDWQCCNSLFGLVIDWNWANNNRKLVDEPHEVAPPEDNSIRSELDWFTTIRAKAGLTLCDVLFYLTAGAAVAHFETKWTASEENSTPFTYKDTKWGWTGGVGVEYLMGCNFSLGAEILYMQFPEDTKSFTATDGERWGFGHSESVFVGRIILNYRFGDLCSLCCR